MHLKVESILTDNGREFCGTSAHPYQIYLELNDISHRRTRVRHPQTNGFIERFNRTILDEFFRIKFREKMYSKLDELQKDLDSWLKYYNEKRPRLGYRNMGKTPLETIQEFKHIPVKKET
jgi:transposase InsO family protein